MKFVGIDLHKKTITVWVCDQDRRKLGRERFACSTPEIIVAYFRKLGVFQAVVEATASYEWLVRLLEPLAKRVVLAHPGKMRVIAESTRKNDKIDARVLQSGANPLGLVSHNRVDIADRQDLRRRGDHVFEQGLARNLVKHLGVA